MAIARGTAYIEGQFVPIEEAKISVLDWGFLRSAGRLHLTLPVEADELARILAQCVELSGHEDAYVEIILTRGVAPAPSRDPRDAENKLICFAIPFGWIVTPEKREAGFSVAISGIQRIPPGSVDPTAKNFHWLDFIAGLYDAYGRGASNVILQDDSGNLTEGPGFNVFVVMDGKIKTPDRGVLRGITRRSAIELARALQMKVEECAVPVDDALGADEIFATSTAGGIMPIVQINNSPVGEGRMGPVTKRLNDAYWNKHSDPDWSVAVSDVLAG